MAMPWSDSDQAPFCIGTKKATQLRLIIVRPIAGVLNGSPRGNPELPTSANGHDSQGGLILDDGLFHQQFAMKTRTVAEEGNPQCVAAYLRQSCTCPVFRSNKSKSCIPSYEHCVRLKFSTALPNRADGASSDCQLSLLRIRLLRSLICVMLLLCCCRLHVGTATGASRVDSKGQTLRRDLVVALQNAEEVREGEERDGGGARKHARRGLHGDERGAVVRDREDEAGLCANGRVREWLGSESKRVNE
eukprot:2409097-Pleurochrysis_carterae.AAC.1